MMLPRALGIAAGSRLNDKRTSSGTWRSGERVAHRNSRNGLIKPGLMKNGGRRGRRGSVTQTTESKDLLTPFCSSLAQERLPPVRVLPKLREPLICGPAVGLVANRRVRPRQTNLCHWVDTAASDERGPPVIDDALEVCDCHDRL